MLISSSVGGKTLVYSLCPVVLVAFVLFSKLPCQVINDSDLFNLFNLFYFYFILYVSVRPPIKSTSVLKLPSVNCTCA